MTNEVSKEMLIKDAAGNFRLPELSDETATSQVTIDSESPYKDASGVVRFPEISEK